MALLGRARAQGAYAPNKRRGSWRGAVGEVAPGTSLALTVVNMNAQGKLYRSGYGRLRRGLSAIHAPPVLVSMEDPY